MVAAGVTAVVVSVLAFAAQFYTALGCGLNENIEPGSDLDRFCDGPLAQIPFVIVPIAVVLAGAAAAIWRLEIAPLVIGACVALVVAAVPFALASNSSTEAPGPGESFEGLGDSKAPEGGSGGLVQNPPSYTRSPEQHANEVAQIELRQVSDAVGRCLARNVPAKACEDPVVRGDEPNPISELRVRVASAEEWRVVARTRGVLPTHTYALHVDRGRGRIVHTCAPRGTRFCTRDRFVERLDAGTG